MAAEKVAGDIESTDVFIEYRDSIWKSYNCVLLLLLQPIIWMVAIFVCWLSGANQLSNYIFKIIFLLLAVGISSIFYLGMDYFLLSGDSVVVKKSIFSWYRKTYFLCHLASISGKRTNNGIYLTFRFNDDSKKVFHSFALKEATIHAFSARLSSLGVQNELFEWN